GGSDTSAPRFWWRKIRSTRRRSLGRATWPWGKPSQHEQQYRKEDDPEDSGDSLHGEPRIAGVVGLRVAVLPGLQMPVHLWLEEHQYEPTDDNQQEYVQGFHDKPSDGLGMGGHEIRCPS